MCQQSPWRGLCSKLEGPYCEYFFSFHELLNSARQIATFCIFCGYWVHHVQVAATSSNCMLQLCFNYSMCRSLRCANLTHSVAVMLTCLQRHSGCSEQWRSGSLRETESSHCAQTALEYHGYERWNEITQQVLVRYSNTRIISIVAMMLYGPFCGKLLQRITRASYVWQWTVVWMIPDYPLLGQVRQRSV